ncbi:ABC transporter ATP-binding protein/permease [Agrobacterium larrymoorei]|uniref:ABC transporter ATP-binding protein/permease n=1 Tax=Agrobacterium larrymoorei TaxID=160699 RepID=A0A4D7DUL0_9HYPH|nr:ABC transporter ATP-binding protein/permease [Agrobacterium larrymoorei]QCJ00824.1 ABC transporter ATP-binding protein/permease [Agrobacterium larrymoorei]QYA10488.1 ABC transporter ATP-binding protein/permease [Agrobacterium larrymoorei]
MVSETAHIQDENVGDELTPEQREEARKAFLLRRFWISARGYWSREGDRFAWPVCIGLLVLIGLNVCFQYGINVWNRGLFDAIEQRNSANVYYLGSLFPLLVLGSVTLVTSQVYVRMLIQRRWRSWLTKGLIGRWLANGRYYQLNLIDGDHQNPEARISEDMRIATEAPVDFTSGVISAFVSASTFIVVLWTIGGALTVPLGGSTITIPGFLVIAAILYATITSGAIAFIGRNFVRVSETKNQVEAEFRYTLTRVRENGESIALLGGEEEEREDLSRRFANVRQQWRLLANQYMRTTLVSHSSMLIAPVVPVLLCAPKFLDGSMTLGQVMQAASAFTIVQGAFGWLVDNYPRLADWNACARRVASLMMSLDGLEQAEQSDKVGRVQRGETSGTTMLSLENLSVSLGDGTAVVKETQVVIEPGERVLVAGESGSGKSTLVRAISGLWPWGGGHVDFHPDHHLFMLPQKPYIPTGTLRRAVSYPQAAETWEHEDIGVALEKVGLGQLIEKIDDEAPWDHTLSGGEKQRLAFARLLLHKPNIIVLDEATSALDEKTQDKMMAMLIEELPDATVLSVAHRVELEAFHTRKITLEKREGGARLVSDVGLMQQRRKGGAISRLMKRRRRK